MPRQTNVTPPMLEEMRQTAPWLWICCRNVAGLRRTPMAITPLIVRWGADASSAQLRASARFPGALVQATSTADLLIVEARERVEGQ